MRIYNFYSMREEKGLLNMTKPRRWAKMNKYFTRKKEKKLINQ